MILQNLLRLMSLAMSCLDVMYHQSYGAAHHYLPATPAAAAAAYRAAYQQQQQVCGSGTVVE